MRNIRRSPADTSGPRWRELHNGPDRGRLADAIATEKSDAFPHFDFERKVEQDSRLRITRAEAI